MSEPIFTYLSALQAGYTRTVNIDKAIELITTFRYQLLSDKELLLNQFEEGTTIGDLLRQHLTTD